MALVNSDQAAATVTENTHHKEYHDITMGDIKEAFKEDFSDEMEDFNKYCDMAQAAEEMGNAELAKGLYMVAHDEYTHAKFIHDNLVDWGCEIPEKEMLHWHETQERMKRKFRRY